MTKQELMDYSKEELATWILRNSFLRPLESDMKHIHIQYLLDKDAELTNKAHIQETALLEKVKEIKGTSIDQKYKKAFVYDQYFKLRKKNIKAYEKRQKEINKCMEECYGK